MTKMPPEVAPAVVESNETGASAAQWIEDPFKSMFVGSAIPILALALVVTGSWFVGVLLY